MHDKPEILELSFDDYYQSPDEKLDGDLPYTSMPEMMPTDASPTKKKDRSTDDYDGLNEDDDDDDNDESIGDLSKVVTSLDFLNVRRGLGTHDYVGQRVHQVASIIRNLTFIEENQATLVRNRSFIRFLVMCSNIRWGNLHHMALDMLGNVAPEIELTDPSVDDLSRCMLCTISDGLESPDRGVIISCLEVLNKLCQKECNEEFLHKCLDQKTYAQICLFLSLNDIMLLLYTLECIYALTSLGEKSCSTIVQVAGVIDALVSLVTVEAQSYGPDGCILMRVVETVPTNLLVAGGGAAGIVAAAAAAQAQPPPPPVMHQMQQMHNNVQQPVMQLPPPQPLPLPLPMPSLPPQQHNEPLVSNSGVSNTNVDPAQSSSFATFAGNAEQQSKWA